MTVPFSFSQFLKSRKPALDNRGGGQALPPFLQGRTQAGPMITPRDSIVPGETRFPTFNKPGIGSNVEPKPFIGQRPPAPAQPVVAQPTAAPIAAAKPTSQTLFDFLKQDLESERNKALAGTRASAASRGVFYGTPLTTSEGDIETSFLRGLGQLQAGILGNEQQLQLQKLGLIPQLLGRPLNAAELGSGGGSDIFQTIGSLFAPRSAGSKTEVKKPITKL